MPHTIKQFIFIYIFLGLVLTSCENKEKIIQSASPDKKTIIMIIGKKSEIAGPWNLTIQVTQNDETSSVITEMYTDDPNEKNLLFNWKSNTNCTITIIEQDGTQRSVPIILE